MPFVSPVSSLSPLGLLSFSWDAYWDSRTPSDIVLTPVSDTSVQVDWTDGAEAADGIRIYVDGVLDGTADYGDGTYTIDGLMPDTEYEITVVAYHGTHESPEISDDATTWTSEYDVVYDSWTNKPSAEDNEKYNSWVKTKIDSGAWAIKDVIYNFAIHTNDDSEALVNWKNPGTYNATLINTPIFTPYEGFTGNGANASIDTNWNTLTNSFYFTRNDSSLLIYSRTPDENTGDIDVGNTALGSSIFIACSYGTNKAYFRLTGAASDNDIVIDGSGLFIANRTASNVQKLYRNNELVVDGTQASDSLTNQTLAVLGMKDAVGGIGSESARQISFIEAGGSLTDAQRLADMNAAEAYMDSHNKGVIPSECILLLGDKTSTPNVAESTGINAILASYDPDYIIGIGDYEDATREVSDLNVNLTALDGDIYACPGNHDTDYNGDRVDFNAFWGHGRVGLGSYQKVSTDHVDFFIHDVYLKDDESGYNTYLEAEARSIDSFKNCTQGQWLIAQIAASTKPWKILVTHQPPWGSNNPALTHLMTGMQWDWASYGIDLILCGHGHFYERMLIDTGSGNIPLIQLGPGGSNHIDWGAVATGSLIRINENTDADFNAGMLHFLEGKSNSLIFRLYAINSSFEIKGDLKDSLILTK